MTAKTVLKHSFKVAKKDLTELFRNRFGLVLLIVMPFFMMIMVGYIYPSNSTDPNNIDLSSFRFAIANQDSGFNGSTLSTTLVTILTNQSIGGLNLSNATSLDDIQSKVRSGALDGGIVIPSNFSESIMRGQQATIIIVTDQSNPTGSNILSGVFSNIINKMGTSQAIRQIAKMNPALNETQALALIQPFIAQSPTGSSSIFDFIAPGIMAMTVMMSVMTGLPVAISQEREVGTMDGMMVAPINRLSIILGKSLAQLVRGLIQGLIILALAVGLFHVTIAGAFPENILLVFGLLLLGVFSFVGLGIVITTFTKDQETAQMLMMTLMFPMMFLSGVFFPIQQMPWFMQDISKVLPLTYASQALRKVMVLGATIPDISTELIVMIVFGLAMIAIAVPLFRRMMTR